MKKSVFRFFVVIALALMASIAQAQTQQSASPQFSSWVIGVDFAPAGLVHSKNVVQPIGTLNGKPFGAEGKNDPWVVGYVAYRPLAKFGGEFNFSKFGTHGNSDGSIGQDEGRLPTWGVDATPKIVQSLSSPPVLYGPVGYSQKASTKIWRADFLGNYTFDLPEGSATLFVGPSVLSMKSSEDLTRSQNFLLYTLYQDRTVSSVAIKEIYSYSSMSTSSSTLYGLLGGVGFDYCITSKLSVDGRAALGYYPWGSTKVDGQFKATKDISLVAASGGVNANPTQTIAHLNWAPTAMPYAETVKKTVTAIDMRAGLKWRIGVANIGLAISRSSLSNMTTTAGYVIANPYAVGYGKFSSRTASMSVWSPVLTVGFWF